ncbi:MAG: hypothetical protein ABI763_10235 [Bacteroidota bacterium]
MNTLNNLKSIIFKLKREEVKSLIKFQRYYQDSTDKSNGKAIQLVENILTDPQCTAKDIQVGLYGRENYHAFNKLLNRTKDKIYEVLLFDQNLSKSYYSERNRVVFEIRKKLMQSEVLYLRGMTEELEAFQNKIISKAKEYEVYDSLIEALQAKQRFMGFRFGKKEFNKIENQIILFEENRKAVQRSRSLFTKIGAKINQSESSDDYIEELNESLKILEEDFQNTNSATVGYYFYYLQTESFQINHLYEESQIILNKLLELVTKNPSIYTRVRHGDVVMNIANNEILIKNYDSAIQSAVLATTFYEDNSVNQDLAKELEFFARFYKGEIDHSEKILEEIYNSSRMSHTPFLYSKRAYLLACIKNLKGEIQKSDELLSEVKEIEKDKEGWNLGKRIMTIINKIEKKDFESADLKVLSLEKFIKRILKFRQVRKRDITILRILLKLINEGFNFEKVYEQRKRYFELLESDDPEYKWKVKSPEIIIFHEWFKKKILNGKSIEG